MKTFFLKEMTGFGNWKSMFLEKEARLMASTKTQKAFTHHPFPPVHSSVRTDLQMQIILHTPTYTHISTIAWWTRKPSKRICLGPT